MLDLYEREGSAWAALRDTALIERGWLDRFRALLPHRATIVDVGCGSGAPIARALAAHGHRVTGVDGARTMLALFRRTLPDMPAILADMRGLSLGRRFDGVLAWDSLFHLSPNEQRATLPRLCAHVAPGGALMFTSGDAEGIAVGTLAGEPLLHGSLDPVEYRAILAAAGMEVVAQVARDPDCGEHSVWLARRR